MIGDPSPGLAAQISGAMRAIALACAGPGETGAQAVSRITRAAPGTVSRWLSYDRPDAPPLSAVAALELACGRPIVSAVLAGLTGHRIAPTDPPGTTDGSIGAAVIGFCREAGVTIAEVTESLADQSVTPAEARADIAACHTLIGSVRALMARLSPVAGGGDHES